MCVCAYVYVNMCAHKLYCLARLINLSFICHIHLPPGFSFVRPPPSGGRRQLQVCKSPAPLHSRSLGKTEKTSLRAEDEMDLAKPTQSLISELGLEITWQTWTAEESGEFLGWKCYHTLKLCPERKRGWRSLG